jgi:hypothetical protein
MEPTCVELTVIKENKAREQKRIDYYQGQIDKLDAKEHILDNIAEMQRMYG